VSAASSSRLRELLAERATWGLSRPEERELACLRSPASAEPDEHELAAAAIHLALVHELEPKPAPLPPGLRARLVASAGQSWDENRNRPT